MSWIYFVVVTLAFVNVQSEPIEKIDYTLNLIKQGDSIIKFGEHENIILLLGNTGGGKSTLAQLMAGDNDQLFSKEIGQDTGEYVIEDKDNKISQNSTLVSQTIFPELVFDTVTDSAYYDCPGFSDTRNSSIDIASTYFIRKVITSAKTLKSIFVVNYSSVKEGVDRNDFLQLLRSAATLYKNFDLFKDGVALVVTKVDNIYVKKEGELVLVQDDKIITNIAEFLNKAKISLNDLIKEEADNNKKENYFNAIKLVDILLTSDSNGFNRIGIFRRPDQAGPLSKIPLLQEGKIKLANLIQNQIQYIVQQEPNFGYTISEESKSDINDLIEQINENIRIQIVEISKDILNSFMKIEGEFINLNDLKSKFQISNDALLNMVKSIESITTPNQLYEILNLSLRGTLQLPLQENNLLMIKQYDNFLDFIKVISTNNLDLKANEIIQFLNPATKYVTDSINVYTFITDLHIKLQEWSIQKDTTRFNVANFKILITSLQNQNLVITGDNIKPFLDEIYYEEIQNGYSIRGFDSIKSSEFSVPKINVIFEVIDLAMDPKLDITCENNNKLIVKGNIVKMSQVISSAVCPEKLQRIEIFGLNRVVFDQDLQQVTQSTKILIASDIWEVIDVRQINLIGESAVAYPDAKAANGANGAGGVVEGAAGANGIDGLPGQNGQSGGAFFGISSRMINGQNMVIKSIGGSGGMGQEGGNGGNGEIGKDVNWVAINTVGDIRVRIDFYEQKGGLGGVGGNGGQGGKGGNPGLAGEVQLIVLADTSAVNVQQVNGAQGPDNVGGTPGIGESSGNQCTGQIVTTMPQGHAAWNNVNCQKIKSNDGVPGNPGSNIVGMEPAESVVVIDGKIDFVNKFKNYIVLNSSNRIRINTLTELTNNLNINPAISAIQ